MKSYCTVADVLSVAIRFKDDVWPTDSEPDDLASHKQKTKTIARGDVELTIEEASEMVRAMIKPQYDSAVIDSYEAAGYPKVIIFLTKTYSAILMFERYAPQSVEANQKLIESLKRSMTAYEQIIVNGALTDQDGNLVERTYAIEVMLGRDNDNYKAFDELKDTYENGRVY